MVLGLRAHAGFVFEPMLGVDSTTTTATTASGAKASSSSSGLIYGARLGYSFGKSFWMAGEYLMGNGSDDTVSATKYTKSTAGLLIGREFGQYNIWAGFGALDTLIYQTNPELTVTGTNVQFGVGHELKTKIMINLGIIVPMYKKAKAGGNETDISAVYSKFNVTSLILTFSYPLGKSK